MTAVYIQNISPHRILNNMTHKEAFTGKKPSVDHLRIFRSPAYIHVLKDKLFGNLIDVKSLHKLSTRASILMKCMCIFCARSSYYSGYS